MENGLTLAATTAFVFGCIFLIFLFVLFLAHGDVWSWRWRYLIAGACVLEAAAVAVAIALVALDSATVGSLRLARLRFASSRAFANASKRPVRAASRQGCFSSRRS